MKQRSRRLPVGVVSVTLIVILVFAFSIRSFVKANNTAILERNSEFLRENTEHHAKAVSDILKSRLGFVENLAVLLERSSESDYLTFIETLHTIEENTFLDDLFFVTPEGKRYSLDEQQWELQDTEFFQKGIKGESGITELKNSLVNPDKQCVSYYAPVWRNGEVTGLVVGCNYYENFGDLYEMTVAESYIHGFLMAKDGRILLSSKVEDKDNFFSFLEGRMEPEEYQKLLSRREDSNTVFGSYRGDYGEGLVCFSALGINDWYVLQLFPSEKTEEMVAPLNKSAYFLETAMLLCLILAVGYTLLLTYGRYNQKNRLMEMALEALAESYPRIVRVNFRTGDCIFIKDAEKMIGKTFRKYEWKEIRVRLLEAIHPEDLEKFKSFTSSENMRRVREQGLISDTCIYRRQYSGEYQWLQAEILPVSSEDDCILMYTGKVDETVKAEEFYKVQLWETMQKAKEAETAKSELLKYMSQNLKTPVNAMVGMSELAEKAVVGKELSEAGWYLGRVSSLGNYTLTLLDDMMQIGVMQEQHMRCTRAPFSVRKLLDGYREYCEEIKQTDRNIRVETEYDDRLKEQYIGDEARIMQLLGILLSNAFQFNHEGGCVTLRVQLEKAGEKSDCVSFAVRDTGTGINEEYKPFLEEAFTEEQPYDAAKPGMGLGLSLAKLALNSIGGRMQVESVPGEGSCFTVFLDLEHVSEEWKAKSAPCRVLVADDNDMNLEIVVESLRTEGYDTVGCSSGRQALQTFLNSEPGYYHVLLTDSKMPEIDGNELAREVRRSGRSDSESICIIALAASSDAQERDRAAKDGIEAVLEKPFRVTCFNEFLQKRRERGVI